jgi:hypothetical protein
MWCIGFYPKRLTFATYRQENEVWTAARQQVPYRAGVEKKKISAGMGH